ncbi:DUF433 domain-containing protein [Duganella callida]|nr:DUF433 domain-containing protein [Duganella callida]
MEYESSHSEKHPGSNDVSYWERKNRWMDVMPIPEDDIEFDEDCPPLESGLYANPVFRFNGRILPPRKSPLDPVPADLLAYIKSRVPQVQMEPHILCGTPVFANTLVPIKRMFDYLLAGKSLEDFLRDHSGVSAETAADVLKNEATLFYEDISIALDSAAGTQKFDSHD